MNLIDIDKIVIKPGRFRGAEDIDSLVASFKRFGQLQPVILDDEDNLIAGFRRYTAAKSLQWGDIAFVRQSLLSDVQKKEIELEENVARLDMTWQERIHALAAIDKLKRASDPNWTQGQTAAVAGPSAAPRGQPDVSVAVQLDKLMEVFPELKEAKSINQARSWALSRVSSVARIKEVKDNPAQFQEITEKIRQGDSVEVIKELPAGMFRAIVTDPPFGIDYERRKAGTEQAVTAYKDDEKSYQRLLTMAPDLFRVLKDDGFLVWFLGPTWWEECKSAFTDAGFLVDEIPVIWYRRGGRAYTTRPDRYLGRIYDMALWCIKGNPELVVRNHGNVFEVPPVEGDDRELLVERPIELYEEIIKLMTHPGETVADFFVGSGSCPAAAAKCHREYFGVELDPTRYAAAIKKIQAHTPTK